MKIDPNLIIEKIENLSIDATLIYLAKSGIEKFVDGYESIKRAIQEKFNEGKYGFVPNREEALFIQKTRNNSEYKEIILLIPKYKYLELIRTGFLIKEYNRRIGNNIDKDKNKERVSEIKFRILSRPGGNSLLKIIKFSSTEFFSIVIKYLHNLKMNGYPEEHLENEFIDLTEEWTKDSLFVKNDSLIEEVKGWCQNKIEKDCGGRGLASFGNM